MSYLDLCKDIKHQIFLRLPMTEVRKYPIKFDYIFMTEWVDLYSSYFLEHDLNEGSDGNSIDLHWPVALTNLKDCPIKYQNGVNKMLAIYEFLLCSNFEKYNAADNQSEKHFRSIYRKYLRKWKQYQHDFLALFQHFDPESNSDIAVGYRFKRFSDLVFYYYKREDLLKACGSGKIKLNLERVELVRYSQLLLDDELIPLIKDYYNYLALERPFYSRYDDLSPSYWRHLKIGIDCNLVKSIHISGVNHCLHHHIAFKQILPLISFRASHITIELLNIVMGNEFRDLSKEDHRSFIKSAIMNLHEMSISDFFCEMVLGHEYKDLRFKYAKIMIEEISDIDILLVSDNAKIIFNRREGDEIIDLLYAKGFRFLFYPEIMSAAVKNKRVLSKCHNLILEERKTFRKMQLLP